MSEAYSDHLPKAIEVMEQGGLMNQGGVTFDASRTLYMYTSKYLLVSFGVLKQWQNK